MTTTKSLCVAALFLVPSAVFSAGPDEKLHEKCLYPTVLIRRGEENWSGGTGVIVHSQKVGDRYHNVAVTCDHIFSAHAPYYVEYCNYEDWSTLKGYTTYPCRLVASNEKMDLAVVAFASDERLPVAELGFDEKLYIGTEDFHFGCGVMDEPRLDYGRVTSVRTSLGRSTDVIRTSVFTVCGDSGGPLFCNYKVVGITQMVRQNRDGLLWNMSYAVPVGRLKKWDEEQKHDLDFIHKDKALPSLPYMQLRLEREMSLAAEKSRPKGKK